MIDLLQGGIIFYLEEFEFEVRFFWVWGEVKDFVFFGMELFYNDFMLFCVLTCREGICFFMREYSRFFYSVEFFCGILRLKI